MDDELAKFQGDWMQVAYERDGVTEPQDDEQGWHPRTSFVGNTFVVTIADGSTPIKGTFTFDPTQAPKTIDYTDTFGADAGSTFLAIYHFEGEQFVFCAADSGQARPKAFETKRGEVLRVFARDAD